MLIFNDYTISLFGGLLFIIIIYFYNMSQRNELSKQTYIKFFLLSSLVICAAIIFASRDRMIAGIIPKIATIRSGPPNF